MECRNKARDERIKAQKQEDLNQQRKQAHENHDEDDGFTTVTRKGKKSTEKTKNQTNQDNPNVRTNSVPSLGNDTSIVNQVVIAQASNIKSRREQAQNKHPAQVLNDKQVDHQNSNKDHVKIKNNTKQHTVRTQTNMKQNTSTLDVQKQLRQHTTKKTQGNPKYVETSKLTSTTIQEESRKKKNGDVVEKNKGKISTTLTGRASTQQQPQPIQQKKNAANKLDHTAKVKQRSENALPQRRQSKSSSQGSQGHNQHNITSNKQIQHAETASNRRKQTEAQPHDTENTHLQAMTIQESSDSESSNEDEVQIKERPSGKELSNKVRQQLNSNEVTEDDDLESE